MFYNEYLKYIIKNGKKKKIGLEPGLTPQSEFQTEEGSHAMLEKRLSHELALHPQT